MHAYLHVSIHVFKLSKNLPVNVFKLNLSDGMKLNEYKGMKQSGIGKDNNGILSFGVYILRKEE